jgi:archaeal cell division control protein 6
MGVFKDMLGSSETLFKNPLALDYDFIPKMIPFREQEQKTIVSAVMPLMQKRNGRNMFVYGSPGIGKTVAIKSVLQELEEETDEIIPVYVNCWSKNTTFKVFQFICEELGYPFTQNKKTEDLFKIIKERINQKAAVFVFDEIDKAEDIDFIYMIIEEIYRSSIILVTNYHEWIIHLDQRVKSRLMPESLDFLPYKLEEVKQILSERVKIAFYDSVFPEGMIERISQRTFIAKDIRTGLFLLRESATFAEQRSSKAVSDEDVRKAIAKIDDFKIKSTEDLDPDSLHILGLIREHSGEKIGTLFELFSKDNDASYKTFQRRIAKLEKGKYISVEPIPGGSEGKTSLLHYNAQR